MTGLCLVELFQPFPSDRSNDSAAGGGFLKSRHLAVSSFDGLTSSLRPPCFIGPRGAFVLIFSPFRQENNPRSNDGPSLHTRVGGGSRCTDLGLFGVYYRPIDGERPAFSFALAPVERRTRSRPPSLNGYYSSEKSRIAAPPQPQP